MSDRPEYRTLFVGFAHDQDVHELSGDAFKALIMLKLSLPVVGIGVMYISTLRDQVGCDAAGLEAALAELERPKPGKERGWIRRDGNVFWLINALACEPGMTPANKNHVKFVRKLVSSVDNRSRVVAEFRGFYPKWFQGDKKPIPKPSPRDTQRDSDGIKKPSESHSDPSATATASPLLSNTTSKSGDLDQERSPAPPAAAPRFASLAEVLTASAIIAGFWRTFYPRGTTSRVRRDDVGQQLLSLANGDAVDLGGQPVRAYDFARLAAKCAEVSRETLRDPDKAIVVLLKKLGDTSDGSAPGAIAAAAEAHEELVDATTKARDLIDANAWLEEHPDVESAINDQLERDGFPASLDDDDPRVIARRIARDALVLAAWRDHHDPDETDPARLDAVSAAPTP